MKLSIFTINWRRYLSIAYLPLILIAIFILQTHLFNIFLGIGLKEYFIRRSIISLSLGVLLFAPAILLKPKIKYGYLFFITCLTALVFIVQYLYYSYSGGFLQISSIFYAKEGITILDTVRTLLNYQLLFFILNPLIVIGVTIYLYRKKIPECLLTKKEKINAGIIIMAFILAGYGYLLAREYADAGNIRHLYQYNKLFNINAFESKVGIINFSFGEIVHEIIQTDKATAADMEFLQSWTNKGTIADNSKKNFGLAKGRNLIIIQVESLENAVIGQKINGQEITPYLNQLLKDSLYFPNYYTQIGPGTSADAEFSTLNSLYPLPDTVAFIKYAHNDYLALPGLLVKNGYGTYAFHGDVASFWNRANIYPQLGYQKWFFGPQNYTIPREIGVYDLGDEDFFAQSLPKLQSLPEPFMATFITLTSHSPFKMPPDLESLIIPATSTLNATQRDYLQSVRYTDKALENFINQLKKNGIYDNSLIAIFGDHGSFSNIGKALGVQKTIFPGLQNSQVPLLILAPKTKLKGVNKSVASHLDLFPTLANLLGITPPSSVIGRDILNSQEHVFSYRNLLSGTVQIVFTDTIAYHASDDGIFERGLCLELPNKRIPT